ncbi:MAG: MATE family efflux transporter [Gammaproteobacteria bacterium]|jgi:multidrug resistance protein, MATE family|nr:MATE family efflux transporter [Gammaproteobacteria bacterium]MBT5153509.1 MATE family efflux transporter [Gammaproteobacteria bacterium]MBT7877043.1 MATE family efflux transporter [Gammaproteobacteria bacterium]
MTDRTNSNFNSKTELKAVLNLGWPIVLTQLFIMLTGSIDAAMAGHYSSTDLAGVSLGGMIMWPVFMLMTGLTMALTPITAQLRGARQEKNVGHQIRQGLWVCCATASILVVTMAFGGNVFVWFELDPGATEIAKAYLAAAAWGAPPVVFYVALRHTFEGLGHPRPPMWIAGSMIPINAFLNYGFIYGQFGLPELGGVGCGYATAIVFWVELVLMLFACRQPFFAQFKVFQNFEGPDFRTIKSILVIGTPIGLTIFLEMAVFSVIGILIARLGVLEVAANSIAGNLNWATYVIPAALGNAASIRVGFHVGARDFYAARATSAAVYKFSIGYALIASAFLVLARYYLIAIFTTDPSVINITATLVLFIAVYQLVDDSNAVTVGALRGYKDTRVPMYFGLVGFWFIATPLGYALSNGIIFPGLAPGVYGYWAAMTLGLSIVAVAMALRLWHISGNHEKILAFAET